jgi:hypothetical protein
MKFNWKVLIGLVVLVGAIFWGVDSVRTRSYSGNDLNFGVGSGPVTITNSTDAPVPAQFTSTGTRPFSVTSASDSIVGSSTREGTGRTAAQLFAFDVPPGVTELMVVSRGTAVNFVADTDTRLDVVVQPLMPSEAQTTMIAAAVVALGALFFVSRATSHSWIKRFRPAKVVVPVEPTTPAAPAGNPNMGRDGRMYSDV